MTTPSEAVSSSAEGGAESFWHDNLAAKTIEIISTEAQKLSQSDSVKAMESLTSRVMEGVGELQAMNGVAELHYWVFIGLSVAAFAVERYMSVGSTENKCRGLLLKILELAKDVKHYSQEMADERETVRDAVVTIVEGAVICCDYLEILYRFWSATTAAAQLLKTKEQLRDFQWRKDYVGDKDVFLSHSGQQKDFVRQVHVELSIEHVNCFFDQDRKSLPLTKKFAPLIFKATETCKIAVMVISREFIRSKWPLLELSAFCSAITSGQNAKLQLFPIFFKISPKELSQITKDNSEWQKLPVNDDTRIKWEEALKEVSSINGVHFSEGGNEKDFRDSVVKEIRGLLKRITPIQLLDFKPVGIEEQVRKVKAKLDMEGVQSALAVIVCGFAGVGKSTVAASVVESLDWSSTDFKFCRVAIDEKIQDRASHIIKLQNDILDKLGEGKGDILDPVDGRIKIREVFKKKCSLLLFIDNVVEKGYISDLLPKDLNFPKQKTKLRIIITSRDKTVTAELNIMCKEYEMIGLSDGDSKSLFSEIILRSHHQVGNMDLGVERKMINEVAAGCRGVPLLLSVFGNHLRVHRSEDYYQEALGVLKEGNLNEYRGEDLGKKLMFVYNKIEKGEVKEVFMDICTYYHGWEWNLVVDIVGFPELDHLRTISFVSNSGRKVIFHDILRLIGMKEAGLSRFSNHEELSHALENNSVDLGNVEGIAVVNDTSLITIQSTQLEAMHQSLRVLMLGDWVTLDGPPCDRAFTNLRYLSVGDIAAFPFKDPSKLLKLKVFLNRSEAGMNLSTLLSCLKRISHEVPNECNKFSKMPFQNLSSLKSLIVHTWMFEQVELPEELHLPPSLVDLDLRMCKNVPKDICHLTALESLILDGSDFKCLPQGLGKLRKLKVVLRTGFPF